MSKYTFLFIFLILGCQNNWSVQEQDDFKHRCEKYKSDDYNINDYKKFCDCILKNSIKLNLPYAQFLETDFDDTKTDQILKSCIDAP